MPLYQCPDCHKDVSDQAPACPHCGRPFLQTPPLPVKETVMTRNGGCGDMILIILLLGAALVGLLVIVGITSR
jgi:hypothetical protein